MAYGRVGDYTRVPKYRRNDLRHLYGKPLGTSGASILIPQPFRYYQHTEIITVIIYCVKFCQHTQVVDCFTCPEE